MGIHHDHDDHASPVHSHDDDKHPHHGQNHGHHHHHSGSRAGNAFRWSIALNSGLTALQLAIGISFGSLALIGDALYNAGRCGGAVPRLGGRDVISGPPNSQREPQLPGFKVGIPVGGKVKPWKHGIGRRRFAAALVLDSPAKGRPYGELFLPCRHAPVPLHRHLDRARLCSLDGGSGPGPDARRHES